MCTIKRILLLCFFVLGFSTVLNADWQAFKSIEQVGVLSSGNLIVKAMNNSDVVLTLQVASDNPVKKELLATLLTAQSSGKSTSFNLSSNLITEMVVFK